MKRIAFDPALLLREEALRIAVRLISLSVCLSADGPCGVGGMGEFHLYRHRHWHRQSILRPCLDRTGCVRGAEQQVRHHGQ